MQERVPADASDCHRHQKVNDKSWARLGGISGKSQRVAKFAEIDPKTVLNSSQVFTLPGHDIPRDSDRNVNKRKY